MLPGEDLALLNFTAISQAPNFTDDKADRALAHLEQNYDKPYRRVDFNDRVLLQSVEKVIETADQNNKREFLVKDSQMVNLLFKGNSPKDLEDALKHLVEKYSLISASTRSLAEAYTYHGCACLNNNYYADACSALESADQLLAALPDSIIIT